MTPQIQVLERLALMGPNLHSHQPCIKWKLDLGPLEERPSNTIPGFIDSLMAMIPSLVEHRCSEGVRGGFRTRLELGTWMGHVMEHIALELQNLAGSKMGFGRARSAGERGVYNVVYQCEERETGLAAGELALELIEHLVAGESFPYEEKLAAFKRLHYRSTLGPSTKAIVDAATARGIPALRLDEYNFVQLGHGELAKKIQATTTSLTSHHGVQIAADKDVTRRMLSSRGIPTPPGESCRTIEEALRVAEDIGWPLVVKPLDASRGRGIQTNLRDEDTLRSAFEYAKQYRDSVIVERFLPGNDFRLLVIDQKFVAAARRIPAHVVGDGEHTIAELVEIENRNPLRGDAHENFLTKIRLDAAAARTIGSRGLNSSSVPPAGETVLLRPTANLSTGGTAIDVTDQVHPANVALAERIALLIGLDIAGIDFVAERIDLPLEETGGGVVEVNSAPDFRMHLAPAEGKSRAVGEAVVDMLFPRGAPSRIPILTVTGTNGKTTTGRLCAHIALQAGHHVGLATTDGIYIRNRSILKGDLTGPHSAGIVLQDPAVNFAVLETARGGILRAGLGYDWSDVAIVTNIAEDHIGLGGVKTLEDLARVKAVTVERVFPSGYAVLNAEDAMTPLIRKHAECQIALFSLASDDPAFRSHVDAGGLGATVEQNEIVLYDRKVRVGIAKVSQVPLTFDGRARFNVANTVAAVAAAYAIRISVDSIRTGIRTFFPSVAQTPGRTNFVEFDGFTVLIDYAHNPHGVTAMAEFVRALNKRRAVATIAVPGDRRDSDIEAVATIAASAFDEVILREDYHPRGRERGEVAALMRGAMLRAGFDEKLIHVCTDEMRALELGLEICREGDLLLYFADKVEQATEFLERKRMEKFGK